MGSVGGKERRGLVMAKRCIGIRESDYHRVNGVRCCNSPMTHYPDYCPARGVVDCMRRCADLAHWERPCYLNVYYGREVNESIL